ncbi:hypothetical protein SSCG_00358 [Streptomyces clavuligerus]|nr:hypothetical protein SSCG_00358 [Streptomyces clavuligerus]
MLAIRSAGCHVTVGQGLLGPIWPTARRYGGAPDQVCCGVARGGRRPGPRSANRKPLLPSSGAEEVRARLGASLAGVGRNMGASSQNRPPRNPGRRPSPSGSGRAPKTRGPDMSGEEAHRSAYRHLTGATPRCCGPSVNPAERRSLGGRAGRGGAGSSRTTPLIARSSGARCSRRRSARSTTAVRARLR